MDAFRRPRTPAEKIAPPLTRALGKALPGQPVPVIVRFREKARLRVSREVVVGLTISYAYTLLPALALQAIAERIREIAADPDVETVWLDLPVHTCLDASAPLIGAPAVWATGVQGRGITIGVVDTGVDTAHPDLASRVAATRDFTGQGFGDGHGHGTHVCSIAAGSGVASGGRYIGVAPEAALAVAKVLRDEGSGMSSDVMAGLEWAMGQGARVVNMSLGATGPCDGSDAISAAVDAAWQQGVVICAAAGNEGPGAGSVGSPGCARGVITVGASDDADAVAAFSSRGPTLDGRQKPDICLPGSGIVAARARGTMMGAPVDERYTSASGTSMATPHASGAVALLLCANPKLTPDQVKARLMETARSLGVEGNVQGSGRANVAAAQGLSPKEPPVTDPPVTPPGQGLGCVPTALRTLFRR